MKRTVESEWLDELPSEDTRAIRSRHDLTRINILMRHAHFMERLWLQANVSDGIRCIVELGGGDGSFLLSVAKRLAPRVDRMNLVLVDQQALVKTQTQDAFAKLGWKLECVRADVFDWLLDAEIEPRTGVMANLFLHHFGTEDLHRMFRCISSRSSFFAACEPRRTSLALNASRLLGLIGCNSVSRHDAPISVRAGFKDRELSALWPQQNRWQLNEHAAGLFSHCFLAQRCSGLEDHIEEGS